MAIGTFTFLFTDIEGSTRLWEDDPDGMRDALRRHDGILRAAIESHEGLVFKTVGDAFYGAFPGAEAAARACLQAQRELQAEQGKIKVRMALHSGQVEMRDNDYFGPPLNRVARLLATAHGEQIVVSQATRDLLGPEFELTFLGTHRLKDLSEPERIWQMWVPGGRSSFPAIRSIGRGENNLPGQVSPIIGREQETSEVSELVESSRMVTIAGPGGAGKTRLAMHLGGRSLDKFADGVWLVDLAPRSDPDFVAHEIAEAIRLREIPGKDVLESLVERLRDQELLLILDNCEHVLADVANVVAMLLGGTQIHILATSREAVGVPGERVYRMPSLSLPREGADFDAIAESAAVRLFVDRAQSVQPAFQLTPATAAPILELCRKLDGLPLALELAAAKAKVLNVEQIAQRVDDRFRLLSGGHRTAVPRQQTLRALVDWSYDLLKPDERRLLRELAVFAGSWTLEGAEAVCGGNVLDLLSALVDKSLVSFDGRYGMLETVRQYALEKLAETGHDGDLRRRHRDYYLRFAERAASALRGPHQAEYLQALDAEHGNLCAALTCCADDAGSAETGLRLSSALRLFWDNRGHYSEGRMSFERALAHPGISRGGKEEADALCNAAILAWNQADYSASRSMQERALAIRQAIGDASGIAESLLCLGSQAYREGNPGTAQTLLFAALGMSGESEVLRCQVLLWLGIESLQRRSLDEARSQLTESLELAQRIGWGRAIAMAKYDLADVEFHSGNFAEMRDHLDGALAFSNELGTFSVFVIEAYAELAGAQSQYERASRLLGAAEGFRERKSLALPEDNRIRLVALRDLAMNRLGDRFPVHYAAGRKTAWDEILFEARHEGVFAVF